jgi:hypothetical protein
MRILIIVTVAALMLSGWNANQGVNLSSQTAPGVVAGPNFPDYNPYNPITYAQTSGLYGGGQNYHGAGR